jgi:hypothetical protein
VAGREVVDVGEEARRLLDLHGGDLAKALAHCEAHFNVIQARSQFLLTLGTLTLTITGFSGPRIAESGLIPRLGLAVGLVLVLAALLYLLLGSLRIRWVTQGLGDDPVETLSGALAWRDVKTRHFMAQLSLLVLGLASYVLAVVAFVIIGG